MADGRKTIRSDRRVSEEKKGLAGVFARVGLPDRLAWPGRQILPRLFWLTCPLIGVAYERTASRQFVLLQPLVGQRQSQTGHRRTKLIWVVRCNGLL